MTVDGRGLVVGSFPRHPPGERACVSGWVFGRSARTPHWQTEQSARVTIQGQKMLHLTGSDTIPDEAFYLAAHRARQFMTWPPFLHGCLSSAWPRWPRELSPAADPAKYNLHPMAYIVIPARSIPLAHADYSHVTHVPVRYNPLSGARYNPLVDAGCTYHPDLTVHA